MWGSDYSHFDSTYPGAFDAALKTFDAIGDGIATQIVRDNPRRYLALS